MLMGRRKIAMEVTEEIENKLSNFLIRKRFHVFIVKTISKMESLKRSFPNNILHFSYHQSFYSFPLQNKPRPFIHVYQSKPRKSWITIYVPLFPLFGMLLLLFPAPVYETGDVRPYVCARTNVWQTSTLPKLKYKSP
jgi:hypothetical protein